MTEIAKEILYAYMDKEGSLSQPKILIHTFKELLTQLKIEYEIEEDVEDWCIDVNDILRIIEEMELLGVKK